MSDQIPKNTEPQPIAIAGDVLFAQPVRIEPDQAALAVVPARPRVWTIFVMYFLAIIVPVVVCVIILFLVSPVNSGTKISYDYLMEQPENMIWMFISTMFVIFALAMVGASLSPTPWRERLRFKPAGMAPRRLLASAIGAIAIGIIFAALEALELIPISSACQSIDKVVAGLSGWGVVAFVAMIGLLPGISEEFLFRGYIQTRLSARWGRCWSIFLTALLFAVFHMEFAQGISAFAGGLYLGALTERTGSIVPAMICHAAHNIFGTVMPAAGIEITPASWPWLILIVATIILCVCVRYIWRPDVVVSQL